MTYPDNKHWQHHHMLHRVAANRRLHKMLKAKDDTWQESTLTQCTEKLFRYPIQTSSSRSTVFRQLQRKHNFFWLSFLAFNLETNAKKVLAFVEKCAIVFFTIFPLISWKWISQTFSTTSSSSKVIKPNPRKKSSLVCICWLIIIVQPLSPSLPLPLYDVYHLFYVPPGMLQPVSSSLDGLSEI